MHGTSESHLETGLAAKDLGQSSIQQESDGQDFDSCGSIFNPSNRGQYGPIQIVLHDLGELLGRHFLNGRQALGQDLPMTAMGTKDKIILIQKERLSHHGCLLTD